MKNQYFLRMYTNREGWKYLIVKDRKYMLSKKRPEDTIYNTYSFQELKDTMKDFRKDSDYMLKCAGVPKTLRSIIMLGRFDKSLSFQVLRTHSYVAPTNSKESYDKKLERKKERREQIKRSFLNDIAGYETDIESYIKSRKEKIEKIKRKLSNIERKAA